MLAANYNTRAAFISADIILIAIIVVIVGVIIIVIIVVIIDVFEIIIVVFGTIISSIVMNAAPWLVVKKVMKLTLLSLLLAFSSLNG